MPINFVQTIKTDPTVISEARLIKARCSMEVKGLCWAAKEFNLIAGVVTVKLWQRQNTLGTFYSIQMGQLTTKSRRKNV